MSAMMAAAHEADIVSAIGKHPECRMLEIGGGNGSLVWAAACKLMGGKLTVIETDEIWSTSIAKSLREAGFNRALVVQCWSLQQILAALDDAKFDVILIDSVAQLDSTTLRVWCMQQIIASKSVHLSTDVFMHDAEWHLNLACSGHPKRGNYDHETDFETVACYPSPWTSEKRSASTFMWHGRALQ